MGLLTDKGQELLAEYNALQAGMENSPRYLAKVDSELDILFTDYIYRVFDTIWTVGAPIFAIIVTISLVMLGVRFMSGELSGEGIVQKIFIRLALVSLLGLWPFFDQIVVNGLLTLPNYFGSLLLSVSGTLPFGAVTPMQALDVYIAKSFFGVEIVEAEVGGFLQYVYQVFFIVISIGQVIPLAGGILISKAMVTFLTGLAPIFLMATFFESTKGMFEGYVRQILSPLILVMLIYGFIAVLMSIMDSMMGWLAVSLVEDGVRNGMFVTFFTIGSVFTFMAWNIQGQASGIAGGYVTPIFKPGAATGAAAGAGMSAFFRKDRNGASMATKLGSEIRKAFRNLSGKG
jgi:hypothetical protein